MKKTVAIVEDSQRLKKQLVLLLESVPDIECSCFVNSGEEALEEIPKNPPDVVLMDINLPGMSGVECVSQLKMKLPEIEIIMLTIYEDSESIFNALKAGATGYLIKSSHPEELVNSIRSVYSGGSAFSSAIARRVVEHFQNKNPRQFCREKEGLTPREGQIIELLAKGYVYKEVAQQLGIEAETARRHVKNICLKMHVRNRVEAVAKFVRRADGNGR